VPGRQVLDYTESHRAGFGSTPHIFPSGGIAIHRRIGPGGDVEPTHHVFRQDAVERVVERYPKRGLAPHIYQDSTGGISGAEGRVHWSRTSE
jgi:hypothetical protein